MLLCIGLIVAGVLLGFRPEVEEPIDLDAHVVAMPGEDISSAAADAADKNFSTSFEVTPRQVKEANAAIAKYEAENKELGKGPEVEKNLYRLGNIYYSMKFDYEKAIYYYSKLLEDYPETDKIQMVYVALADSYGKLEKYEEEMNMYDTIMKKFPENSPAYQFAYDKLREKKE